MSIPQTGEVVKCIVEGCEEEVYRDGLCWEHFIAEKVAEWDAQDAERRICLEGVGLR